MPYPTLRTWTDPDHITRTSFMDGQQCLVTLQPWDLIQLARSEHIDV